MTPFPRNDMFSSSGQWTDTLIESYVYQNGQPLGYASMPYWKKDILQTSATSYVRYVNNDRMTFVEQWLCGRQSNRVASWLLNNTNIRAYRADNEWLAGYVQTMGLTLQSGDLLQLCQLHFTIRNGQANIHQTDTIAACIYP